VRQLRRARKGAASRRQRGRSNTALRVMFRRVGVVREADECFDARMARRRQARNRSAAVCGTRFGTAASSQAVAVAPLFYVMRGVQPRTGC